MNHQNIMEKEGALFVELVQCYLWNPHQKYMSVLHLYIQWQVLWLTKKLVIIMQIQMDMVLQGFYIHLLNFFFSLIQQINLIMFQY